MEAEGAEIALEAEIGHDGDDDAGPGEEPLLLPGSGDDGDELVAVDDPALLVDEHDPVGVAVERDADVGADLADLGGERLGRGRADVAVDVEAVRLDADGDDLGTELPQDRRRHLVGGAVGAVDDDAQPREREVAADRALDVFDIAVLDAVDAPRPAELGRAGEALRQVGIEERLDLGLALVGELCPVRAEELDAVVGEGIVRGGDHDPEVAAHRAGEHADRRRRDRAGDEHVHADRGEAGDEGVLDHVAGEAGVLADDDAVAVLAVLQREPRRHADLQRHLRRDRRLVRPAADAVGAEILPCHRPSSLRPARGHMFS